MCRSYDPWVEAERLGLNVIEQRLPHGRRGEYDHVAHVIRLAPRMSFRESRSVLTHEIQHAIVRDIPSPFGLVAQRQEIRARRQTARLLIEPSEYLAAESIRGPHIASIAHDLDVTIYVVQDWIAMRAAMSAAY